MADTRPSPHPIRRLAVVYYGATILGALATALYFQLIDQPHEAPADMRHRLFLVGLLSHRRLHLAPSIRHNSSR